MIRGLVTGARGMRGGAWALASLVVALVVGAARSLVAARLIGAHEVGMFGFVLVVLATVDALSASAADTALITHPGEPTADLDLTFSLRLAHGALGALLLWAIAPLAGMFFAAPSLPRMLRVLAVVPLVRGALSPAATLLVRRAEFRRLFWWGVPELIVATAVLVGVGVVRRDAWAPVASVVAGQAVQTALSYAMAPYRPRLVFGGAGRARMFHFGRWTQGTRILMFVALYLDNALVGKLLGASSLGLYQIAFRIGEIPAGTLGRAAAQAMLPALTAVRSDRRQVHAEYVRMARPVIVANIAIALAITVTARPMIGALLGTAWLPAVPVTQILAVAMVLRNVMQLGAQQLYAVDEPRRVFLVHAVRVAVLALSIYPLARRYHLVGVALSVAGSCLGGALATVIATRARAPRASSAWRDPDTDAARHAGARL